MNPDYDAIERFLDTKDAFGIEEQARVAASLLEALLIHSRELETRLSTTDNELQELQFLFNLMDLSNKRAMRTWRNETGQDVWPDHSELVKWLLDKNHSLTQENERLKSSIASTESGSTILDVENSYKDEISRLTKERDEARGYGSAAYTINVICDALDLGGVSASKLAEMLGQPLSQLRPVGLQRVANAIFDACHGEVYESELEDAKETISHLKRREPTADEADQCEGKSQDPDSPSLSEGECFVPLGGWTGRRCVDCRKWTFGGPTRCLLCASRV